MQPLYVSQNVSDSRLIVDWEKGFKSDISYWAPFARKVSQSCQASVTVMGFDNPQDKVDFLPDYREETYQRFFWDAPEEPHKNLTHIAGAHSLGALLLLEHLIDDEKARIFSRNYSGLYLANPFLGDPWHDNRLCRAFSRTWWIRSCPTGSTQLERAFGPELDGFEENPTHLQSDMLHAEAQKFLAKVREKGGLSDHLRDMPISIIAGENDPACDNNKIYEFAEILGLDTDTYPGTAHNPLLCNAEALNDFTYWVQSIANSHSPSPTPPTYDEMALAA